MIDARYHPLPREQIGLLLAPENAELEAAWDSLTGALHGLIAMLSVTHPRPLYHYEEPARRDLVEQPERLRGTPFHAFALENVRAAEELEKMFREHGHTDELHEAVDHYLDDLVAEFDAMRLYPELPPPREPAEDAGGADQRRAVAGR